MRLHPVHRYRGGGGGVPADGGAGLLDYVEVGSSSCRSCLCWTGCVLTDAVPRYRAQHDASVMIAPPPPPIPQSLSIDVTCVSENGSLMMRSQEGRG